MSHVPHHTAFDRVGCGCDSCAVAAFDDDLTACDNINWDWNAVETDSGNIGDIDSVTKLPLQSCDTVHSELLSRIHATIQSLIAGEKVVQHSKAVMAVQLTDTLANYDSVVDDVIRHINGTRARVKDEIRGVFESAVKRLDAQIDELAVSIGQLEGLANVLIDNSISETDVAVPFAALLTQFTAPVCRVSVKLPRGITAGDDQWHTSIDDLLHCVTDVVQAGSVGGVYVATLATRCSRYNNGLAVNDDASLMAVSTGLGNYVTVYRLPSGEELVEFQGNGTAARHFRTPRGLCFTVDGTLLVVDGGNKRIVDVTLQGEFKRTIGKDILTDPAGVTANADVIVVCFREVSLPGSFEPAPYCKIAVFDYRTGSFVRGFTKNGMDVGMLNTPCAVQLTPDGCGIIVAEDHYKDDSDEEGVDCQRLSLFTVEGEFVRVIADGQLSGVCFASNGDIIGAGWKYDEIVVLSPDGAVLREFGSKGVADGQFVFPKACAFAQGRLYVLDNASARVQVFE